MCSVHWIVWIMVCLLMLLAGDGKVDGWDAQNGREAASYGRGAASAAAVDYARS